MSVLHASTVPKGIMPIDIQTARKRLEDQIEDLIDMLDILDGDPDLEPYLADTYPEADDREGDDSDTEPNGDEDDFMGDEGDQSVGMLIGGSGL